MADNNTDAPERAEWDVEAERVPQDESVTEPAAEPNAPEVDAERERLIAERTARREARLAALAPEPEPEPIATSTPLRVAAASVGGAGAMAPREVPVRPETVPVTRRNTDRFAGSLGLFLLRLVTAAIVGAHGLFHLLDLTATTAMISKTLLPSPSILAIVVGAAEIAIAIALVFGLLTRLAGLGLALVAGLALGFVIWGNWSPFEPGKAGFAGELELLLVAVGFLFLLVGAGGWSIDRGFRARRQASKET